MNFKKTFVSVVATLACSVSFAAGFTSTGYSTPAYASVEIDGSGTSTTVGGAEFYGTTNIAPVGSFAAFCLEPTDAFGSIDPATATVMDGAQALELSKLFTAAGWESWNSGADGVTTDVQRIGLQLAVWDIMADGVVDFASGNFKLFGPLGSQEALVQDGIAFIAGLNYGATGTDKLVGSLYRLSAGKDSPSQDLVIAVPEPSTYALMIAGLAAVGFVSRRRAKSN